MSHFSAREAVSVSLGSRSYEITIGTGQLAQFAQALLQWCSARKVSAPGTVLLVTDEHLARSHAAAVHESLVGGGWSCQVFAMPPGEPSKSLPVISEIYDSLVDMQAGRQTVVVAVGGGVVGDAAGFAAATYARGVPFVQIPTTLLAQVDSSVGGKVGINHPRAKNLIGAFHQPLGVFIDTDVLATLPVRDYRSGLAEVVKYGVILDAEFFAELEGRVDEINRRDHDVLRRVVSRSCRLKADVVEQDEFEQTGLRAALNYGHTFAHAFEALAGYGELLHGEAVAIGMICASRLAERLALIDASVTGRQERLLAAVGLPTSLPASADWTVDSVIDRMRLDKKTVAGRLRFVLPTRLGCVETFDDVDESVVREIVREAVGG